jgi:hypothetical protein
MLSLGAVIPASVAGITSISSDLDTRSLAHLTNPAIMFCMGSLLLFVHVGLITDFPIKRCS